MRLSYPADVKIIQVPCTGRVDILHLLNAIEDGADGVYVAGCLEGECHYLAGNLKARKKVEYVKRTLTEIGIEPERVEMYNLSSAQGARFAEIANEMVEKIKLADLHDQVLEQLLIRFPQVGIQHDWL